MDFPAHGSGTGTTLRILVADQLAIRSSAGKQMRNAFHIVGRMLRDEDGTEVLEWGLVAGLIVVGCIAAITLIGPKVKSIWEGANSAIPSP